MDLGEEESMENASMHPGLLSSYDSPHDMSSQRGAKLFPMTFPFSEAVPKCCHALHRFLVLVADYAYGLHNDSHPKRLHNTLSLRTGHSSSAFSSSVSDRQARDLLASKLRRAAGNGMQQLVLLTIVVQEEIYL